MISKEQLREIRAALTWGDHHYGTAQAEKVEGSNLTQHAMHRRAKAMELIPESLSFEGFLDSVIMTELGEVLDEERNPTMPSTSPSQPSASTGE